MITCLFGPRNLVYNVGKYLDCCFNNIASFKLSFLYPQMMFLKEIVNIKVDDNVNCHINDYILEYMRVLKIFYAVIVIQRPLTMCVELLFVYYS